MDKAGHRPPNYYAILSVASNATPEEIRTAYRARIAAVHPDRNPSAHAHVMAVLINKAWEVLGDSEQRRHYDATMGFTKTGESQENAGTTAAESSVADAVKSQTETAQTMVETLGSVAAVTILAVMVASMGWRGLSFVVLAAIPRILKGTRIGHQQIASISYQRLSAIAASLTFVTCVIWVFADNVPAIIEFTVPFVGVPWAGWAIYRRLTLKPRNWRQVAAVILRPRSSAAVRLARRVDD